ncbi:hypothetical protein C2G38_2181071 [Gigaspora rosea]|uniref:Uncharacterized protein n=1 Tax=Gigaspora rosea TaxID=44941 RepID=A0A397VB53_9GLOM|nr:hypothetical protein C2G38_2181071 [Gigaspora rosea]
MEVPREEPMEEEPGCIFAGFVEKYSGIGLSSCGTKEQQKWRGFKGQKTAERLKLHYNQFFVNPQFHESLVGSSGFSQENKRSRLENEDDLAIELDRTKRLLETTQQENQQMSQLIMDLNGQIEQMRQYLKDQRNKIEELKKQLQESCEDITVMRNLYEKEYESNKVLTEQWNLRFASQQKRIDAIIEIAKAERVSLLNDIDLLIQNNSRFSLENLMPRKAFQTAVAVDSIYGARHGKYISEIHLAASAIKYTWQDELSKQEEPLPEELLFLAFDNKQKGQKNYLDRGFNMVTYHIVTSFVAFNMSLENKIQHTNLPWAYDSLSRSQFDELFSIGTQMQEVINEELHSYLAVTDQEVDILNIYIPDPINVNPNSIANIEKILLHIETISGIRNGTRKWVAVTCDGVPYRYATKLKEKFPWLVLIPGQLHEEMNMLRAFVELNWEIDLKRYAICQGYRTEKQLAYFKKCADHHKSWDSICTIYRQAMAMELLWPYVKNHSTPSVEGYLAWVKEQQDSLYMIKYEQMFLYLQAIINYRKAIRTNNPILKRAARRVFSPVWSARRHPIYRLIEAADEIQLMKLHPEIRNIVEKSCVVSRSGLHEQHQGLDAIIEEVNKALKSLIPPIPQDHHWKIAARNCKKFFKARQSFIIDTFINNSILQLFRLIPITKQEAEAQKNEENMTIPEILVKIETLREQLGESTRKNYSGLKSKNKGELLEILEEMKCLLNLDNDQDCLENSGAVLQE